MDEELAEICTADLVKSMTALKNIAASAEPQLFKVLKDQQHLNNISLCMLHKDPAVIKVALEVMKNMMKHKPLRIHVRANDSVISAFSSLREKDLQDDIQQLIFDIDTALKTVTVIQEGDGGCLSSNFHHHEPLQDIKDSIVNKPKPPTKTPKKPKRRSVLMAGIDVHKSITLQIKGMWNKEEQEQCRTLLCRVTGVISVGFDFGKKHAMLRVKKNVQPVTLVRAIEKSLIMTADQVIKDENGKEVLKSFTTSSSKEEYQGMPDYPSDDDSPVRGYKNMARGGPTLQPPKDDNTWISKINNLLKSSFYW